MYQIPFTPAFTKRAAAFSTNHSRVESLARVDGRESTKIQGSSGYNNNI